MFTDNLQSSNDVRVCMLNHRVGVKFIVWFIRSHADKGIHQINLFKNVFEFAFNVACPCRTPLTAEFINNQEIDFIDYNSKHHWQGFFDITFVIDISTCIRFATVG